MDPRRFDTMARFLHDCRSRRGTLAAMLGGTLGLLGLTETEGKNKKSKKPKKVKRNGYGCVNVGDSCRGNSANCCSGICQGKKPKKGKPDKSRCVAHNEGGCAPERSLCNTGSAVSYCTPGVTTAVCVATTGNGGFCASNQGISKDVNCQVCSTDKECEARGFPPGSACAILTGAGCVNGSDCNGTNGSTGTACLPPGA